MTIKKSINHPVFNSFNKTLTFIDQLNNVSAYRRFCSKNGNSKANRNAHFTHTINSTYPKIFAVHKIAKAMIYKALSKITESDTVEIKIRNTNRDNCN